MTMQQSYERMFESLDDMGTLIYRDYMNGNKADARIRFRSCPAERRAYLAFTMLGLHSVNGGHVVDFEEFFKSVTN